ncbi:MAG: DUF1015 domain-containing protein [Clostridia bacterium]|jgi:uncharacterized protein (DUF1015 family)|nr:DUF1015 domain-containing protein [Clostridia bacterium]MCI9085431.1 DUF1015 domain-containing protein [Clostridia bacterium]
MAKIKAFRGYRYNSEKIANLGSVVSPPYYNISEEDKDGLYEKSDYNSVRLFSGKRYDDDTPENSAFTRAKAYLDKWIEEEILIRDEEPVIYMYEQTIDMSGTLYSNTSFVALVELEDIGAGAIKPCENLHEISMGDRYELLAATNSDISMINCLYMEQERDLYNLMNELREEKADIEFSSGDTDDEIVQQRLWKISYKPTIDFIIEKFKDLSLYITDGQTRYETCLKYRNYMKANNPNHTGNEPYNYMMMSLSNSKSDGLVYLPVHREVKTPRNFSESHFIAGSQDHFKVEKIIIDSTEDSFVHTMAKQIATVKSETRIAAYCGGDYFYRMVLQDNDYIKKEVYPEMSKEYCKLDIVALNKLILEDVFHIDDEKYEECVTASRSYNTCYRNVQDGKCDIMFILNPVKVDQIKNITAVGERLPEMSVSVYPKPSVGIIVNVKED